MTCQYKRFHGTIILFFIIQELFILTVGAMGESSKSLEEGLKVQIKAIAYNEHAGDSYQSLVGHNEKKIEDAEAALKIQNFSLAEEICRYVERNLSNSSINISGDSPDIVIEISVEKTGVDSLYGPKLIADTVRYKGINNTGEIFSGEFRQKYKNQFSIFGSIKTPETIGKILAKRIVKELKKSAKH